MGVDCPICGEHGSYVHGITALGDVAKKSSDIIAYKLSCGHVVGNENFMKYRKQVHEIDTKEANAIRELKEKSKAEKLQLWSSIIETKESV